VVISTAIGDIDRAVLLKHGAFDGQGIQTVPVTRAMRLLGVLKDDQMQQVERVVCKWLALP
jgi:hypothetical protein